MKEIVEAYHVGEDMFAIETMKRLFHYFGKAMAVVINILDPDAIVIGGGVGNIDEIYTLGVDEVKKHVFNHRLDTKFYKPLLGDSAGTSGCLLGRLLLRDRLRLGSHTRPHRGGGCGRRLEFVFFQPV